MVHFKWCQHQQGTLQRDVDSFAVSLFTNRGTAMLSNVMLHMTDFKLMVAHQSGKGPNLEVVK